MEIEPVGFSELWFQQITVTMILLKELRVIVEI
jgi:hypothetical protein